MSAKKTTTSKKEEKKKTPGVDLSRIIAETVKKTKMKKVKGKSISEKPEVKKIVKKEKSVKKPARKTTLLEKPTKISKKGVESEAKYPAELIETKPARSEEEQVSVSKYDIESPVGRIEPPQPVEEYRELPPSYGDTKLIALVRDPEWVFAYWEISDTTRAEFNIPKGKHNKEMAFRVYDATGIQFDGTNAVSWFDVPINDYAVSWYLKLPESGRTYIIDLGVYSDDGIFRTIARSNPVMLPPTGVSPYTDEEWMHITEETSAELFRISGGLSPREFTSSENIMKLLNTKMRENLFSGGLSSGSISSLASNKMEKKEFGLIADAELIIYGATEPTAKVTVQGTPAKLTPQGTFSLRFALPDGSQEIPIAAKNEDGGISHKITISVKRKTS